MTAEIMRILTTNEDVRNELAESVIRVGAMFKELISTQKEIDRIQSEIDDLFDELES